MLWDVSLLFEGSGFIVLVLRVVWVSGGVGLSHGFCVGNFGGKFCSETFSLALY